MPEQWYFLILVGLVAGVFSGMFGIGGGVVIVPLLAIFFGFSTKDAIATSLAALLMPVAILAVNAYWRAKMLDLRAAALIAFGLLVTSAIGAQITIALNETLLRQLYGLFLLVMAWRFAEPRKWWREIRRESQQVSQNNGGAASTNTATTETHREGAWYALLLLGLIAGIFSGMFGIGGGAIIVPALVGFLGYDQKRAVGTSLAALLLPVGLPAVLSYYAEGVLSIPTAAMVALGLIGGAVVGANLALGLPSQTVKRLYGVFLVFVALYFIFRDALFAALGIS
jgi:uncharacterized protein